MTRSRRLLPLVVVGVLAATTAVALGGTGSSVHWGGAIEVPGTAALAAGYAKVKSVSCASAGECAAGGVYMDHSNDFQAFVVSEHAGAWGTAIEVPGLAALNVGSPGINWAEVTSVSCGSPGNCAAGGLYVDSSGYQAFVVAEQDGAWGNAIGVPGVAARNVTGYADVYSVSCGGPRTCTAIGSYNNNNDCDHCNYGSLSQTFVVSEQEGVWGPRRDIPGNESSISCGGADSCVTVGSSQDHGVHHGYLVVEKDGKWDNGKGLPGMRTLSAGRASKVQEVSCSSPGNCAAAGTLRGPLDRGRLFVVNQKNGRWSKPISMVRMTNAWVNSVSCTSAGNCAVGGFYSGFGTQAFVVSEKNGRWGKPTTVRGLPRLSVGNEEWAASVSCADAGNCAAIGSYATAYDSKGDGMYFRAFVVTERNGTWGRAQQLRGLGATVMAYSVSCVRAGNCAIGGLSGADYYPYPTATIQGQAFVTAP